MYVIWNDHMYSAWDRDEAELYRLQLPADPDLSRHPPAPRPRAHLAHPQGGASRDVVVRQAALTAVTRYR